jgi:hypothetical protein
MFGKQLPFLNLDAYGLQDVFLSKFNSVVTGKQGAGCSSF